MKGLGSFGSLHNLGRSFLSLNMVLGETRFREPCPADVERPLVEPGVITWIAMAIAGKKSHSSRPCNKKCCMIGELKIEKRNDRVGRYLERGEIDG